MERIDLRKVIRETVATFNHIRTGEKPPLYLGLTQDAQDICWPYPNLSGLVRMFLYETLLTNSPNVRIEVLLSRRAQLRDLAKFVGIYPACWLHLRICGRGLGHVESFIDDLFNEAGYICEEWVGVENSANRLGIFAARRDLDVKIIFCLESRRFKRTFSLLLPEFTTQALPCALSDGAQ
jgi:hypothetical protein